MRIPGHEQRYILVVHGWMESVGENCRRELFHTFVLDCFEDRFRIVSEVRRLGDSEPCVEKCEDAAAVPSIVVSERRNNGPSIVVSERQEEVQPAVSSSGAKPEREARNEKTWASLAGSLAAGEPRSKQLGYALETTTTTKAAALNDKLSRLWVLPADVSDEELWDLCIEICPDVFTSDALFRADRPGYSDDKARKLYLHIPEECASKLVQASKQRRLRTKNHYVKLEWARGDSWGKPSPGKGKKGKAEGEV